MNTSIAITNEGIDVSLSDDDPVGVYMGTDAPSYLAGEPSHFVGKNFTDAKSTAIEYLQGLADEILDTIADLKDLRVRHTLPIPGPPSDG